MKRLSIPLALFMGLGTGSLQAQNSEENLAFRTDRTLIPAALGDRSAAKNCNADLYNQLRIEGRLPSTADESINNPSSFIEAVCLYHGKAETRETKESLIQLFQKSSIRNLAPSQTYAASLYEGLLHCDVAKGILKDDKALSDRLVRTQFCAHRTMAKEALGSIDWSGFQLEYEDPSQGSLDQLMQGMASCSAQVLPSSYDTSCGDFTSLSDAELNAVAEQAALEILAHYIDVAQDPDAPDLEQKIKAQIPPYSAMLARKILMTRDTINKSGLKFDELDARNDRLLESVGELSKIFGAYDPQTGLLDASGAYPSRVAALEKNYLDQINRAQTLVDLADKWERGLYTDPETKENKLTVVEKRQAEISEQMEYMLGKANDQENSSLPNLIQKMTGTLQAMGADREANSKKVTRAVCALYYCDVRSPDQNFAYNAVCTQTKVKGTNLFIYNINPLCEVSQPAVFNLPSGSRTAASICQDAGFPSKYLNPAAMTGTLGQECMNDKNVFDKALFTAKAGS